MLGAAASLLDGGGKQASILQRGVDPNSVALCRPPSIKVWVVNDFNSRHQRENLWISNALLGVLVDEGLAIDQRHRRCVVAVHLGGNDLGRLIGPTDIELPFL